MPLPNVNPQPVEFAFYHKSREIHPSEVFEVSYGGLDFLLPRSRDSFSPRPMGTGDRNGNHTDEFKDWIMNSSKQGLTARAKFNNGAQKSYKILPRVDIDIDSFKLPSIVFLIGERGHTAILRDARVHSVDDMVKPFIAQRSAIAHNGSSFSGLSERMDYTASRQFGTGEGPARSQGYKKVMYVPEPHLLCALEELYARNVIQRITPEIYVLDHNEGHLFYVREHLSQAIDIRPGAQQLGPYFGTMKALGLMDFVDGKAEHYAFVGAGMGNFDPDLQLHAIEPQIWDQAEWSSIQGIIPASVIPQAIPPKAYFTELLKPKIEETYTRLLEEGVTPLSLASHLRQDVLPNRSYKIDLGRPKHRKHSLITLAE